MSPIQSRINVVKTYGRFQVRQAGMDRPRTRNLGFTITLLDCAIELLGVCNCVFACVCTASVSVSVSVPVPVPVPVPVAVYLCLVVLHPTSDLALEVRVFRSSSS